MDGPEGLEEEFPQLPPETGPIRPEPRHVHEPRHVILPERRQRRQRRQPAPGGVDLLISAAEIADAHFAGHPALPRWQCVDIQLALLRQLLHTCAPCCYERFLFLYRLFYQDYLNCLNGAIVPNL